MFSLILSMKSIATKKLTLILFLLYTIVMKNEETKNEQVINVNFNVLNALNLYNEELGESYVQDGFNPLGNDFELSESFITDFLENEKNKKEITSPQFLEQDYNEIAKAFNLSLENALHLFDTLAVKINDCSSLKLKQTYAKIMFLLQLYIELIKKYIKKLKKEKNLYQLYINLLSINWSLSDEMESSFTKNFSVEKIIYNLIKNENETTNKDNEAIKEQARKIIENNLKQQKEQIVTKPKENIEAKPKEQVEKQDKVSNETEVKFKEVKLKNVVKKQETFSKKNNDVEMER